MKKDIGKSLPFLKDIFEGFENEKKVFDEATNNPTKFSDAEYQKKIEIIKKNNDIIAVYYFYYYYYIL